MNTMIRDLTKGKVVPQLLRFVLPLFLSNALQAVYNLVDMIIVGNCIGKEGMSAVSIGGDLLHKVEPAVRLDRAFAVHVAVAEPQLFLENTHFSPIVSLKRHIILP